MEVCTANKLLQRKSPKKVADISSSESKKMQSKMDRLPESWKMEIKKKVSTDMQSRTYEFDEIMWCKLKKFLYEVQKLLCSDISQMTNLDKWIVNTIMMCNAEKTWAKDESFSCEQRRKWTLENDLKLIKENWSVCAKDIFIEIENIKAVERFLRCKFDDVDYRATKVMYYLRNFYRHRNGRRYDIVPRSILNMLCGYDPKDEDLYEKYCQRFHTPGVSCEDLKLSDDCPKRHFKFEQLPYEGCKPHFCSVLTYTFEKLQ